jgi:hypothetical protein
VALTAPYEFLDLQDGQVLITRVVAFDQGDATITRRGAAQGKVVKVVRIHVPATDKPTVPAYWDVSATTVFQTLLGLLPSIVAGRSWLRIQKFGVAPSARFQVSIMPPAYAGPAQIGAQNL